MPIFLKWGLQNNNLLSTFPGSKSEIDFMVNFCAFCLSRGPLTKVGWLH